jgi:hypothetical protein
MSERETFGPRLRAERERRGISLDTLASVTKVSADLWEGLERNDFSRWPSGIFARAFVRDYARAVGLDADELVDEFCRHFPVGDRRASRLIQAQAQLIGHNAVVPDDVGGLPPEGERRSAVRSRADRMRAMRGLLAPRTVAAIIDTVCTLAAAATLSLLVHASLGSCIAIVALIYYGTATVTIGGSPGVRIVEALRQRIPTLFAVEERRRATA